MTSEEPATENQGQCNAGYEPVQGPLRYVLLVVAWVSLVLGLIGLVTPGLPTVPFILVASWAGMRSSHRVHRYLESHRVFGPILRDWRRYGAVGRKAKVLAALSMLMGAAVLWWVSSDPLVPSIVSSLMAVIAIWLWLRPEPPVWR